MANNPYVNKVEYAGQTLMDLTGDTATPSDVMSGATFHDRSGTPQTGSLITHNVYDGLDSDSATDALSAKQGKALNNNIAIVKPELTSISKSNSITKTLDPSSIYFIGTSGNPAQALHVVFTAANSLYIEQIRAHSGFSITGSGLTVTITNNSNYSFKVAVMKFMSFS